MKIVTYCAMACLLAAPAWAQSVTIAPTATQSGFSEVLVSKAALTGSEILLWSWFDLDADCSPRGVVRLELLQPPSHGTVTISDAPFYPSFPQSNVRFACASKKSPGEQAFYTSQAGFEGHDTVVLRSSDFDGVVRKVVVDVNVLSPVAKQ